MNIEDLRGASIDFDSEGFQPAPQDAGDLPILLAQAQTQTGTNTQTDASPTQAAEIVVMPNAANVAVLPATASIDEIQVDGADLVLVQADGSQIRIVNGALNIPTFMIGDVVVAQEVLLAVLDANNINVAAGPDGSLSVAGAGPQSSGANFQDGNDGRLPRVAVQRVDRAPGSRIQHGHRPHGNGQSRLQHAEGWPSGLRHRS